MSDEPVDIIQHAVEAEVKPVAEQEPSAPTTEETASPEGETPVEEPKPESKTFTQEELDKIIRKEKAKVERQVKRQFEAKVEQKDSPVASERPDENKFTNYTDYLEALADWKAEQKFTERENRVKQEQQQQTQRAEAERQEERLAEIFDEGISKYEDFKSMPSKTADYLESKGLTMSLAFVNSLQEATNAHDIIAHLATDLDEAERIARMSPYAQAKEVGKLEDRLSEKKPIKPSNAPAPVTPIKGGTTPTTSIEDMDMDTFIAEGRKRGAIWARNR